MAIFGERFLLGFTSPRSPYLISKYIEVIEANDMEGLVYDRDFQTKFYNVLSKAQVAGEEAGNAKNKAFAGRDKLTRMPQALGFFITQQGKKFEITEAGKLLKDDDLFEDVLIHQMLKYQLPSRLHKEKLSNSGHFRIKPFLEMIRLINTLEYLTYKEMLIFGMTLTDYRNFDLTVNKIKDYRTKRKEAKKARKSLRKFDYEIQLETFSELYEDIIDLGDFSTRETQTKTVEEYMKKKIKNWGDYTDSIFRVLRASGLFVFTQGKSLSVSKNRQIEVDYILENVDREIEPIDISREEFDSYISNPNIPYLLNDNFNELINNLKSLGIEPENNDTLYDLKHKLNRKRVENRNEKIKEQEASLKLRQQKDIDDIIDMFESITNKVIEPATMRPTFYEWNIWRAITMINHGDIKGNFLVDDSGMPASTAGGGQSDIVGDYGSFNIGIEVTLSTGKKQYETESEPVTRHIGEMQVQKPTFGLFIADTLQDTVINHFYTVSHQNSRIYNGVVDIIPMDTKTFIEFFKRASKKDIQPDDLLSIHNFSKAYSKKMLINEGTEVDWHEGILKKVFEVVS